MNTKLSSVSLLLDLRSISPEHKANQRHDNGTSNNYSNNDFSKKFGRRNSGYLRYATKAVAKIIGKSNSLRLFHSMMIEEGSLINEDILKKITRVIAIEVKKLSSFHCFVRHPAKCLELFLDGASVIAIEVADCKGSS
ncbi:hypothetical protein RIF29_26823 [Crotalaria pallida]|uniref:Uncharacterized protein n=1 Tax=Crotalaria pallida TaxID=3830 RepID=A0AAN9I1W3_CROPI